ncbi:hypothetical protein pb186bvf_015671 [Paramecium bursaria]
MDNYTNQQVPFGPLISQQQQSPILNSQSSISERSSSQQYNTYNKQKNKKFVIASLTTIKDQYGGRFLDKTIKRVSEKMNLYKFVRQKQLILQFTTNLLRRAYVLPKEFQRSVRLFYDKISINRGEQIEQEDLQINKFLFKPINATNQFIIIWDIIAIVCCFIFVWISIFHLSFQIHEIIDKIVYFQLVMLILEIFVSLNKTEIIKGEIIYDRKQILRIYYSLNFYYDLMNVICCFIIISGLDQYDVILEIIMLFTFLGFMRRITVKMNHYVDYLQSKGNISNLVDLIILILSIYLFSHILACFWHYVSVKSEYLGTNWLIQRGIQNESVFTKYNYAFYWATMTMVTVGYGDITPQNYLEMMACSFSMFISTCIFAYSMNSIGMIIKNINDSKQIYKRQIIFMNSYMKNNNVDQQLQNRIRNYLKYQYEQEKDNEEEVKQLIQLLPQGLSQELDQDIKSKAIKQFSKVLKYFSRNIMNRSSQFIEKIQYTPGEVIKYQNNQQNETYILHIEQGEVQKSELNSNREISILKEGQIFGQYEFFTGFPPQVSYISQGFCQIYRLARSQFIEIIKSNPKDFQIFHNIKDEILFKNNYRLIDSRCSFCQSYQHLSEKCNLILYKPDIERIIKKQQFNVFPNDRQFYKRSSFRKKFGSLINRKVFSKNNQIVESQVSFYLTQKGMITSHHERQNNSNDELARQVKQELSRQSIQAYGKSQLNLLLEGPIFQKLVSIQKRKQSQQFNLDETKMMNTKQYTLSNQYIYSSDQEVSDEEMESTDQVKNYKIYFPQNNIQEILKNYKNRIRVNVQFKKKYSFFYQINLQAQRLRRNLEQ